MECHTYCFIYFGFKRKARLLAFLKLLHFIHNSLLSLDSTSLINPACPLAGSNVLSLSGKDSHSLGSYDTVVTLLWTTATRLHKIIPTRTLHTLPPRFILENPYNISMHDII
eukprot:347300_1